MSLVEMLLAVSILMIVSGTMLRGTLDMTQLSETASNRAEMFAGVRNATALLAQEVGQAGRVAVPAAVTAVGAVAAPAATTVTLSSTAQMFVGERIVFDTGPNEETVTITALPGANQITATFARAHAAGVPVRVSGGFAAGVIPTTMASGSTATLLKVVGDINGDGMLRYVEYSCDFANARLTRNSMPYDAGAKPAVTVEDVLLDNLLPNPGGTPCFSYEQQTFGGTTYVIGVAITVTVQTQDPDPITGQFQTETKALLNVSPRNVYNVWQLASLGINNRVQPLPVATQALLP
jgi:hypothetical protein